LTPALIPSGSSKRGFPESSYGAALQARQPEPRRIPGIFQFFLALYVIFTGAFPMIVQALAFGLVGANGYEFAIAMTTSIMRDLLLLAPIVVLANQPLGLLHPILLAVVVWPLLIAMPSVIQDFGGWAGVIAGTPVEIPYFTGIPSQSGGAIWIAIAKYNALQILSLFCTYVGFALFKNARPQIRRPMVFADSESVRAVLIGLIALSTLVLLAFLYARGGIDQHLTSLGKGRFRELQGVGAIMVLTDLGAMALYLWMAARPQDSKSALFLVTLAIVTAAEFISNGSRGSALMVPLMVGLIWSLRRLKIPWRLSALVLPFMFLSLGLLGAIRTSSWGGQTASEVVATTGFAQSFALAEKEIELRRSLSAQVPIIERGFEVTGGPLLGKSYIGALAAAIPRSLWEGKPRGAGSLYAQRFLGQPMQGVSIPVSPVAEAYWNFGVPGVVIMFLLTGILLRRVFEFFWRHYPNPLAVCFYALFVTTFAFSTDTLVGFQQQLVLLLGAFGMVRIFAPLVAVPVRGHAVPGHQLSKRLPIATQGARSASA
jgi:hypothetical protein